MDKTSKKQLVNSYKERKLVGGICAIKNTINGKTLITATTDLQGYKNRFDFSTKMGSCVHMKLQNDWKKYGHSAFTFEIFEQYEKKAGQTDDEFKSDIQTLEELWLEKSRSLELYN